MVTKPLIKNVLLIDDDEDDCMVFKMAIAEIDNTIRCLFRNSCKGINHTIKTEKPELIFLDINLPQVNGIECLQHIQEIATDHSTPVVMYSSSELPRDLAASYKMGAALYFRKPNNISSLIAALKNILQMGWHDPDSIKAQYYKDGTYHVYDAKWLA